MEPTQQQPVKQDENVATITGIVPTQNNAQEQQEQQPSAPAASVNSENRFKSKILNNMELGGSGLSIGTHMALETFFSSEMKLYDEGRKFEKHNIDDYDYHVWNIYTIVRNILQACNHKAKYEVLREPEFILLLAEEVSKIAGYYFLSKCKPLLFFPDYTVIYKNANLGKKEGFTKIYEEHMMVNEILTKFKKDKLLKTINDGKGFKLPSLNGRILITTNLAIDLCNRGKISSLDSHTGIVRDRDTFGNKFHRIGTTKLVNIPMFEKLLYILGDRTIIKPHKIEVRKDIYNISLKCKWNGLTSFDKMANDIYRFGKPATKDIYDGYITYYGQH